MPHILQIVADGALGGGTTAVLGLCEDILGRHDFQVTLITQPDSYAYHQAVKKGINVYALDFFTSRFDFRIPSQLNALINKIKPDIIHTHGARAAHPFVSALLGKITIPCVYTVHGYHFTKKSLWMKILGWFAECRIATRMSETIFVSQGDRTLADRYGISHFIKSSRVIYNGVKLEVCQALMVTPKTHALVFMARMHPQKNPRLMIDIMAELKNDGHRLLMIGGGEMEDEVRAYAHSKDVTSRIDFTGALSQDDALRGMAGARLYVLPSLWEGLPIGPIEAMACAIPVIASDISGTNEVVAHHVTGMLVKDFVARAYADAIRTLLNDHDLYDAYSQNCVKAAAMKFQRSVNSQKTIDVYLEKMA
jgi:glycosyltransferase involved in cell wall biosynthesis